MTVADRIAEPDGLWPADFDLLTRLPGSRSSRSSPPKPRSPPVCSNVCMRRCPSSRRSDRRTPPRPGPRLIVPPPESPAGRRIGLLHVSRSRGGAWRRRPVSEGERASGARRCTAPRSSCSVRFRICIWRGTCSPIPRFRSRRSTRCRSRPSRTPPPSISCSMPSAATSRARRCWRCCGRRTFSCLAGRDSARRRSPPAISRWPTRGISAASSGSRRWCRAGPDWARRRLATSVASKRRLPAAIAVLDAVRRLAPMTKKQLATEQMATLVEWLRTFDRPPARRRPDSRTAPARSCGGSRCARDARAGVRAARRRRGGRCRDADGGDPPLARRADVCRAHGAIGTAARGRACGALRRLRRAAHRRAHRRRMAGAAAAQRAVSVVAARHCSSRCRLSSIPRIAIARR